MITRLDSYFSMTQHLGESGIFTERHIARRLAAFPLMGIELAALVSHIFTAPSDASVKMCVKGGEKIFTHNPQSSWTSEWQPLVTLKKVALLFFGFLSTLLLGWWAPSWNQIIHEELHLIRPSFQLKPISIPDIPINPPKPKTIIIRLRQGLSLTLPPPTPTAVTIIPTPIPSPQSTPQNVPAPIQTPPTPPPAAPVVTPVHTPIPQHVVHAALAANFITSPYRKKPHKPKTYSHYSSSSSVFTSCIPSFRSSSGGPGFFDFLMGMIGNLVMRIVMTH